MVKPRIGIVGARVSGSYLAWLLARQGWNVSLFDHQPAKEKACGGGMTFKAYHRVPGLSDSLIPRSRIENMVLSNSRFPRGVRSDLSPPLMIYARRDLDDYLRGLAVQSGVTFYERRVRDLSRDNGQWKLSADGEPFRFDFIVGADGTASLLKRRLDRPLEKEDLSLALGYYVPGTFHDDTIHCRFFPPPFHGYLWSFPRRDHLSVGILDALSRADPESMQARVEQHIRACYPGIDLSQCRRYAAPVPALRVSSLRRNIISGLGWAVVGDAAGFADAISGEGIYYALRSAEILAECLAANVPEEYPGRCQHDFGQELVRAALWKKFFYGSNPRTPTLAGLSLWLAARSISFRGILAEWVAGYTLYSGMPRRFFMAAPRILWEITRPGNPRDSQQDRCSTA